MRAFIETMSINQIFSSKGLELVFAEKVGNKYRCHTLNKSGYFLLDKGTPVITEGEVFNSSTKYVASIEDINNNTQSLFSFLTDSRL